MDHYDVLQPETLTVVEVDSQAETGFDDDGDDEHYYDCWYFNYSVTISHYQNEW